MEKFAVNLDNVKDHILFECIIQKSKVAEKYKDLKLFYTNNEGEPSDWQKSLFADIRDAEKVLYKGRYFLVVRAGRNNRVAYIFYQDCLYAFDSYYADCEIFKHIIRASY